MSVGIFFFVFSFLPAIYISSKAVYGKNQKVAPVSERIAFLVEPWIYVAALAMRMDNG